MLSVIGAIIADLLAGIGLGLLLGTVVGLATSPVVAIVVGALTSVLAVFLGLDRTAAADRAGIRANAVRIGAFGVATVAGFGLGLYVRINNPLAHDPAVQLAEWMEALPDDPTLAKQMMVFERTGIAPEAFTYGNVAPAGPVSVSVAAPVAAAKSAVLFSALGDFDACSRLDPRRFADADAALFAYGRANAPEVARAAGARIAAMDERDQEAALTLAYEILCAVQKADDGGNDP